MARLAELQEKRNKLMNDATALARKEGITAEERTQVTAMLVDVDAVEADTILGKPVFINEGLASVPAVAGANIVPVQFGDFKASYRARIVTSNPLNGTSSVGDLTLIREDHLFIGTLEVGFLGIVRMGGNVINPGTPALVNLTMKSS